MPLSGVQPEKAAFLFGLEIEPAPKTAEREARDAEGREKQAREFADDLNQVMIIKADSLRESMVSWNRNNMQKIAI